MPELNQRELEVTKALNMLTETPSDEAAWTIIYERMWSFVVAACYRHLGSDRDRCEDAAQAVFLKLLAMPVFPKFEHGIPQFKRFLDVTCKRLCLDWARQSRRRAAREQWSGTTEQRSTEGSEVEEHALINEIIEQLTADERSLLNTLLAGHTLAKIADLLGTSISSAQRKRDALRLRLAELLGIERNS